MPSGIARVLRRRKADGKRAQIHARKPTSSAHESIECLVQLFRIDRLEERWICVQTKPYHGLCPRRRIIRVESSVAPEDRASLLSGHAGEGTVDADKSLFNKLFEIAFVKAPAQNNLAPAGVNVI